MRRIPAAALSLLLVAGAASCGPIRPAVRPDATSVAHSDGTWLAVAGGIVAGWIVVMVVAAEITDSSI